MANNYRYNRSRGQRTFSNYNRNGGFRYYGGRAVSATRKYGGRAYNKVRNYQTVANRGIGPKGFKVYPDLPLGAGVVVGLTNVDRQIPGEVILAGAALPIGGKYGRSIRNFFGGVILGELVSKFTGFNLNFPAQTKNKTESVATFYA